MAIYLIGFWMNNIVQINSEPYPELLILILVKLIKLSSALELILEVY